jgi:broad specificity phosphatase PhoE
MHTAQMNLLAGALDNLMRLTLTGCRQSAHRTARILLELSELHGLDEELRRLCGRVSVKLEQEVEDATHAQSPRHHDRPAVFSGGE